MLLYTCILLLYIINILFLWFYFKEVYKGFTPTAKYKVETYSMLEMFKLTDIYFCPYCLLLDTV